MRTKVVITILSMAAPLPAQTNKGAEAWRAANGPVDGVFQRNVFGELQHNKVRNLLPGEVPAFVFNVKPAAKPSTLPSPNFAFGVSLGHHEIDLKEFVRFRNLHTLRIHHASFPLESHASLADLKQLKSLAILQKFPDASLKHLAALPELEAFEVSGYSTSDKGVETIARFPKLHTLVLDGTKATDESLLFLARSKSLKTLSYCTGFNVRLRKVGVKRISQIATLESLALRGSLDKDLDWSELTSLRDLRHLKIWNQTWTDKNFKELSALKLRTLSLWPDEGEVSLAGWQNFAAFGELESLSLYGKLATDEALKAVGNFGGLRTLTLVSDTATDAGAAELTKLSKLETLDLQLKRLTDQGMKHVAKLPELRYLDVSYSKITDAGLRELVQLKKLRRIRAYATGVTRNGLRFLTDNLPELRVTSLD